jgi:ferredoxin
MPWVDKEKCIGCKICVQKCPVPGAIEMVGNKAYIHNDICTRCGICMEACPKDAIRPNSENPAMRGMGRGRGGGRGMGGGMGRGMGSGRGMGRGRF